jgi:PhnB protein
MIAVLLMVFPRLFRHRPREDQSSYRYNRAPPEVLVLSSERVILRRSAILSPEESPREDAGGIMAFYPYLFFGGNCREAFTRYEEIFGGELTLIAMKDMPSNEQVPDAQADLIMHAALKIGDDLLMASDDPMSDPFGPVQGMQVNFSAPEPAEAKRVFNDLADGGKITLPIAETSWSPAFGMCIDRFGTPWMISADGPTT